MTAGLVVVAPSAHAADQRPCVSKAEYYGLPRAPLTRVMVEARWEVTDVSVGAGRNDYRYFVSYPVCGYGGLSNVTVSYRIRDHVWRTELLALDQDGSHSH